MSIDPVRITGSAKDLQTFYIPVKGNTADKYLLLSEKGNIVFYYDGKSVNLEL